MNKLLIYLKMVTIFIILELTITFITSLLNLLGLNSGITQIIILVSNLILFFILNYYNASIIKKRGFLEGIILGIIFIITMFLIKIILLNNNFTITTIIYYLILFIISILGGMLGVNKKSEK